MHLNSNPRTGAVFAVLLALRRAHAHGLSDVHRVEGVSHIQLAQGHSQRDLDGRGKEAASGRAAGDLAGIYMRGCTPCAWVRGGGFGQLVRLASQQTPSPSQQICQTASLNQDQYRDLLGHNENTSPYMSRPLSPHTAISASVCPSSATSLNSVPFPKNYAQVAGLLYPWKRSCL